MPNPMTKTEFAQGALSMIVTYKVTKIAEDQFFSHTNLDPEGLPAKLSSFAIGGAVSAATRPYTDKIVEKSVVRVQSWRAARKAKKSNPE